IGLVVEIELAGITEIHGIGGVEGFGAEFDYAVLVVSEALEEGRIEILERRPAQLVGQAAQDGKIRLADLRGAGRLGEGTRVEPLRSIVRAGIWILAGHEKGVAAEIGGGGDGAADIERLAALISVNVVEVPSAHEGVEQAVGIAQQRLVLSEG